MPFPLISSAGAQTVGPTSGGKVTPINNLGTSALLVIGANQYRAALSFANPGTVTVYVAPTVDKNNSPISLALATLGGSFPIQPGGWVQLVGETQLGWQAIAASGVNNPLTVMESNT